MFNQAFVRPFQISDLFSPIDNHASVSDSELLTRNSRVIWAVIAVMSVATIVGYWAAGLAFSWATLQAIGLGALPCLAVAYFYRRVRSDIFIGFGTESFAQLLLALALGGALTYPLATVGFPYCDALLNGADVWMGLDWRAYLRFVSDRPPLGTLTLLAYQSVLLQLVLLLVVLVFTRRFVRSAIRSRQCPRAVHRTCCIHVRAGGRNLQFSAHRARRICRSDTGRDERSEDLSRRVTFGQADAG